MERVYLKKGPNRDVVKGYEREVLNGLNDIDYEYTPYGVYKLDEDNCYNPIINYSYAGADSFWKGYCDGGKFVVNSNKVKIVKSDENTLVLNILTGKADSFIISYIREGEEDITLKVNIDSF